MRNIESLTIHQFRGLQNLELKDTGQINILVGVNNAGKTSVLEAISTYCRPLDLSEWLSTALRREISPYLSSSKLESLKWLFPQQKDRKHTQSYQGQILMSGTGNFQVRKLEATYQELEGTWISKETLGNEEINDRDESLEDDFSNRQGAELELRVTPATVQIDLFQNQNEIIEKFQIWENDRFIPKRSPKNLALPVATITPFSHRAERFQIRLLSDAIFQDFKSEVIELLNYMDSGIIDLELIVPPGQRVSRPSIYIRHKQTGISPISAFGDGVPRLLSMALMLLRVKEGILLIDELGTAIHTEALQFFFEWLIDWSRKMKVQIFATTHSLEVIDALLVANTSETDLVVYRIEPDASQTNAVRLDRNLLKILREELGQEVRW
ncbi:AAA family ATPase [Nodularia spumigena]|uniref:AAA family ATPase n=1 Tax=Nodularia spumigena TaxID=70799 RepID=UPI00232CBD98|nr:AAA family ATPase [Nodularia spumigena]MDB9318802.1 AAA family ATPase [Nodularia spumigena CS-590/01A]MDB9322945.1 AAA family ATPase [Nodularia spumigena CS-591/07A]MDB9326556.1 AAA family ATPase [Nodularia spumigena CS-590/02]MDB9329536.1 AAA family ATPase [Nodularia spumigena CS-591/04]MDB9335092.1 AAA family ATPase [Nodularia spumigena CS-590/01]